MSWPTTTYNGVLWYIFEGRILMPVDPTTGAPILMLRPEGGMGVGIPPIADGAAGPAAALQTGPISFTELAAGDPTPGGISVTEVSPGLYALTGALHSGADGAPGTVAFNLSGIGGSAAAGKIVRVNSGPTGFDFAFELVGDRFIPTTGGTFNTTAGTADSTVAQVSIGAKNFDYRVRARGYQIVRQNGGADVQVDLLARLNGETGGNIVSRCQGLGGTERLVLTDMPPAGSADSFDRVVAGNAATIHFRTEQQGGANSYTSAKTEQRLGVDIIPLR